MNICDQIIVTFYHQGRPVTEEEVNAVLEQAANTDMKGILGVERRPLVSVDYVNDDRSSIVDALSTMVVDGTLLKLFLWSACERAMKHMLSYTAIVSALQYSACNTTNRPYRLLLPCARITSNLSLFYAI